MNTQPRTFARTGDMSHLTSYINGLHLTCEQQAQIVRAAADAELDPLGVYMSFTLSDIAADMEKEIAAFKPATLCGGCNGSGQGQTERSSCGHCAGSGEVMA